MVWAVVSMAAVSVHLNTPNPIVARKCVLTIVTDMALVKMTAHANVNIGGLVILVTNVNV